MLSKLRGDKLMVSIESTDVLYCIHKGDKCMYSSITDTSITVFYNVDV